MTSRCNIPSLGDGDNSDTSLHNSSKLEGSTTNSLQVRFIDNEYNLLQLIYLKIVVILYITNISIYA